MRPPSEAEAAAVAAALEWLLAEERRAAGAAATDPRPPQYRSAWRRAALTPRPFEPAAADGR